MSSSRKTINLIVLLAFTASLLLSAIPVHAGEASADTLPAPDLKRARTAVSVTAVGVFTCPVTQSGNKAPTASGVVGQFAYASAKGSLGFFAHNYLAGASFYALSAGTEVIVRFSDGSSQTFVVQTARRYQATDPTNINKPFINENGKKLSAKQVYNQNFKPGKLTFMTEIAKDGVNSWGVVLIVAVPKK